MSTVSVKPIRHFRDHESNEFVGPGDTIEVSESRAVELRQNGLIEDYDVKKAPEPDNKKAPEPTNKAASKPSSKQTEKPKE